MAIYIKTTKFVLRSIVMLFREVHVKVIIFVVSVHNSYILLWMKIGHKFHLTLRVRAPVLNSNFPMASVVTRLDVYTMLNHQLSSVRTSVTRSITKSYAEHRSGST